MTSMWKRTGLYVLLAVILAFLGAGISAYAAGTPAGTLIKNQATAKYIDANGNPQVSTSNEVITIVQPVYAFTITPDGTVSSPGQEQEAAPGNTVYFPYTLTNEGNADDKYTLSTEISNSSFTPDVKIYLDTNGNGVVDPGEPEITNSTTGTVHPDETIRLIVAYTVPSGASDGDVAYVNLKGMSNGDSTQVDENNWNKTIVTTDAVLTAVKSANATTAEPGDTIEYTIEGSNTGQRAAKSVVVTFDGANHTGIFIEDSIPDYTTFVANSTSGSPANGYALYSTDNGSTWTATQPSNPAEVTNVGWFIPDPNPDNDVQEGTLDPGQSYRFVFDVKVNSDAPDGADIQNSATVNWADSGNNTKTTKTGTTHTEVSVLYTYGVKIGPKDNPEATDPNDITIVSNAAAGQTVEFTNTVKNEGGTDDIFNITFEWGNNTISNATVTLYKADGVTPLSDTNGDGIPDVGPIPANGTANIVVKVFIPANTSNDTLNHDITITATSTKDSTKTDTTVDRISGIQAAAMDITNNNGAANTEDPYSQVGAPGTKLYYPLTVTNAGGAADTYRLSQTESLPDGWTVEFYPDTDGDGQPDPGSAPISSTPSLGPGESYNLVAVVSIPEGQTPLGDGDNGTVGDGRKLTFEAVGVNSGLSDTQVDYAEVSRDYSFTFEPDNTGTAAPGGTVFYKHILRNTGTVAQTFNIGLDPNYTPRSGWTYMFSTDGINYYPSLTDISLDPGKEQEIWVKVFVPANEAANISEAGMIRATSTTANTYKTRTDITTVVNANLKLEKSVDKTGAKPGDTLTYTVNYKNLASDALKKVIIYDAIPEYTTYVDGSANGTAPAGQILYSYSTDGGTTWTSWSTTSPTGVTGITNLRWGLDTDGDGDVDDNDTLAAGASGQVSFQVKIK